jgi:hypothetical protein
VAVLSVVIVPRHNPYGGPPSMSRSATDRPERRWVGAWEAIGRYASAGHFTSHGDITATAEVNDPEATSVCIAPLDHAATDDPDTNVVAEGTGGRAKMWEWV